jgi:hypothetical protein
MEELISTLAFKKPLLETDVLDIAKINACLDE